MRRTTRRTPLMIAIVALVAGMLPATIAAAEDHRHVDEYTQGGPNSDIPGNAIRACRVVLDDDDATGVKLDRAPTAGDADGWSSGGFSVKIQIVSSTSFTFSDADPAVSAVIVKGGSSGDVDTLAYLYDPPVTEDTTPLETASGGVSHIVFCWIPGDEPIEVDAVLSGEKSLRSYTFDETDDPSPLAGWEIAIFELPHTEFDLPVITATTNTFGEWSARVGPYLEGAEVRLAVCEVQRTGWDQLAPAAGDPDTIEVDGVVCHEVSFTAGDDDEAIGGLDFENVALGYLSGTKYFGTSDTTLAGWTIVVTDATDDVVCTEVTDADGDWSCGPLYPGTYTVAEIPATNTDVWEQLPVETDPDVFVYTVVLSAATPTTEIGLDFNNVCTVEETLGGRTMGFWSNRNGHALLTDADRDALNAFDLRGGDGELIGDFADGEITIKRGRNTTEVEVSWKEAYRSWLLGANANPMVYMLSAQMTATYLNTVHGITDPDALVTWSVGGTEMTKSVSDWIDYGNTILGDPGAYSAGVQGDVKDLFDAINNGEIVIARYVPDDWTECAAPVFPAPVA